MMLNENEERKNRILNETVVESDVTERISDFFDDWTRGFYTSGMVLVLLTLRSSVNAALGSVLAILGGTWNFFDAAGGYAAAYDQYKNLYRAKRHIKEKKALIVMDVVASTNLSWTTMVTLLVLLGILSGVILGALSGLAFAGCMLAMTFRSVINWIRAKKKTDITYLFDDRVKKYQNVAEKLKTLRSRLSDKELKETEKEKIKKQIREFERTQIRFKHQIKAIHQGHKQELNADSVALAQGLGIRFTDKFKPHRAKLVEALQVKQAEKVAQEWRNVVSWGIAAAGMILLALTPFFPPLLIPTLIVCGVAGAVKWYEIYAKRKPQIQGWWKQRKFKKQLEAFQKKPSYTARVNKFVNKIDDNELKCKSDDEKSKYFMAYKVLKGTAEKNVKISQKAFYDNVSLCSDKEKKKILANAETQFLRMKTVAAKVGKKNFSGLSEKDKDRIYSTQKRYGKFFDFTTLEKIFSFRAEKTQQKIRDYFTQKNPVAEHVDISELANGLRVKTTEYTVTYEENHISFVRHQSDNEGNAILKKAAREAIESLLQDVDPDEKIECELKGSIVERYHLLQVCQEYSRQITVKNAVCIEDSYDHQLQERERMQCAF